MIGEVQFTVERTKARQQEAATLAWHAKSLFVMS